MAILKKNSFCKIASTLLITENCTFKIGNIRVVENLFPKRISHDSWKSNNFFLAQCIRLKFEYKNWKNYNIAFAKKNIFIRYIKHIIMNFLQYSFQTYIYMIFIMIFPADEMFSNFPFVFVTILTLCTMQEKNYTFIITIYCDLEESQL